ncbi:hypothetical protein AB7M49_002362 [Bradyrhizobium elkanii]
MTEAAEQFGTTLLKFDNPGVTIDAKFISAVTKNDAKAKARR